MGYTSPPVVPIMEGLFIPDVPKGSLGQMIGLIGSVIMPHNLFLHSALVLSRKISMTRRHVRDANVYNSIESSISLFISFMINLSVVATFAHYHNTQTGVDLNLRNADKALEASFGGAAKYIWAVGLLAAGQSSTMTGTYAGQFVMEGFLDLKYPVWIRVLVTRCIAILPALAVAFMNNFDQVDDALNILQSIQLPFALIPLLKFVSDKKIMGFFTISKTTLIVATFFGVVLSALNFITLVTICSTWWQWLIFGVCASGYITLAVIVIKTKTHSMSAVDEDEYDDIAMKINVE